MELPPVCGGGRDSAPGESTRIELTFDSKFEDMERRALEDQWQVLPDTDEPVLKTASVQAGDEEREHGRPSDAFAQHTFGCGRWMERGTHGTAEGRVLVARRAGGVEFVADHPGRTLFHCHQQDHMDRDS